MTDDATASYSDTGRQSPDTAMCETAEGCQQLTLFAAGSHARTYHLQDAVLGWLANGADCGESFIAFLRTCALHGLSLKTSPACYPHTEGEISAPSRVRWQNSGMWGAGGCLTLSTLECPSVVVESTLSDILEEQVPLKFYLSARGARGVLERATIRNRAMPDDLRQALQYVADGKGPKGPG